MAKKLPRRFNPQRVIIKRIKRKPDQVVHGDFGSVVGNIDEEETIAIQAQIRMRKAHERWNPSQTGDLDKTDGELILRKWDVEKNGWELKPGDRIIEIGPEDESVEFDAEIIEFKPMAPLRGPFLLFYAAFKQRRSHASSES